MEFWMLEIFRSIKSPEFGRFRFAIWSSHLSEIASVDWRLEKSRKSLIAWKQLWPTGHDGEQEQQAHDLHGDLCPLVFTELLLQSVIQIIKPRAVGPSALEPAWSVIDCNPENPEKDEQDPLEKPEVLVLFMLMYFLRKLSFGFGSLWVEHFCRWFGFFQAFTPQVEHGSPPQKKCPKGISYSVPIFRFQILNFGRVLSYWHR